MDIKKLTRLLKDEQALHNLPLAELDKWIEAYPYVYRLHEARARLVGSSATQEHIVKMTGAGWLADDIEEHEFVTLEEVSGDVQNPATTEDPADVHADKAEPENSPLDQPDQDQEVPVAEAKVEENQEDESPAEDTVPAQSPEPVQHTSETTSLAQIDATEEEQEESAASESAKLSAAEDDKQKQENTEQRDQPVALPTNEVTEPEDKEAAVSDKDFMGEDDGDEPATAPAQIPQIDQPELVIDKDQMKVLSKKDQVLLMTKGGNKKKKKKGKAAEKKSGTEAKTKKKKKTKKTKEGARATSKVTDKKKASSKKKKKKKKDQELSQQAVTDVKKAEKIKSKKKKKKEGAAKAAQSANSYAEWLLAKEQVNKSKKKKKKKKKVVKEAMKSLNKKKGIVSEPLAELLAAQGHINQAILTYEELSLNYPEKSAYFASRIEELKNLH